MVFLMLRSLLFLHVYPNLWYINFWPRLYLLIADVNRHTSVLTLFILCILIKFFIRRYHEWIIKMHGVRSVKIIDAQEAKIIHNKRLCVSWCHEWIICCRTDYCWVKQCRRPQTPSHPSHLTLQNKILEMCAVLRDRRFYSIKETCHVRYHVTNYMVSHTKRPQSSCCQENLR